MDRLSFAADLARAGRYQQALASLRDTRPRPDTKLDYLVLESELLERTGEYARSKESIDRLLKGVLPAELRSRCELTYGLVLCDEGDTAGALTHFQKAVSCAASAKELRQECLSLLRLVVLLADSAGYEAAFPTLERVRHKVMQLGDPILTATLHIFVGEIEAKRGLTAFAKRHTERGLRLLERADNLWLMALAENTLTAIAIMQSRLAEGIRHAKRAFEFASESGAVAMKRAALGNLGNLHFQCGNFDEATECFESARALVVVAGEREICSLESLAQVQLATGSYDLARTYLEQIESSVTDPADWMRYGARHSRLTKAALLASDGSHLHDAEAAAHEVTSLAHKAGDELLQAAALMLDSEILARSGSYSASIERLNAAAARINEQPPHIYAEYERTVGLVLQESGHTEAARTHFDIAERTYKTLGTIPGLNRLGRTRTRSTGDTSHAPSNEAASLLHEITALLLYPRRTELVAASLLAILRRCRCITGGRVIRRANDGGDEQVIAAEGSFPSLSDARSIWTASDDQATFDVVVEPVSDAENVAAINAALLLLKVVTDFGRGEAEREERLTLWPVDDLPLDDEQAIVGGKLREVMSFARRVAATNVSVLLTGESGTGKEILARAIHRYSSRAARPFIPFNCTAVPRELLESQLFGYRRGAFTGADRDYQGLIRAAKDGTLFLDEVGELGLDLQPKLLRFLESGEISPLGEPGPLTVNVRIVAATNANLELLVQQGRFREDLFYRLNVIRLSIPPLRERRDEIPALVHHFAARASAEFGKGRVRVAEETMEQLLLYPWPGNVRQLQNEIRRMVALADTDAVLSPTALSTAIRSNARAARATAAGPPGQEVAVSLTDKLQPAVQKIEREMIRAALRTHDGRLEAAAKALGISRKGLYLKRQRLGL